MLCHPSRQQSPRQKSASLGFKSRSSAQAQGASSSPKLPDDPFQGSALLVKGTVAARKVLLSGQESRQKSHSNFGELKQKAGVKDLGGLRVRQQHLRADGSRVREGTAAQGCFHPAWSWGCCFPRDCRHCPAGNGARSKGEPREEGRWKRAKEES